MDSDRWGQIKIDGQRQVNPANHPDCFTPVGPCWHDHLHADCPPFYDCYLLLCIIIQSDPTFIPDTMEFEDMRRQLRRTDPYDILQVKPTDDDKTIKSSFKRMALKFHPDKNSTPGAKEAFHNITMAYQSIGDNRAQAPPKESFRNAHSSQHKQPCYEESSQKPKAEKPQKQHFQREQFQRQPPQPQHHKTSFEKSFFQQSSQTKFSYSSHKEFNEKIFKMFKDLSGEFQKKQSLRNQHSEQQRERFIKPRQSLLANNLRGRNPPPLLMLLLLLFLCIFFAKMNVSSKGGLMSNIKIPRLPSRRSRFQRFVPRVQSRGAPRSRISEEGLEEETLINQTNQINQINQINSINQFNQINQTLINNVTLNEQTPLPPNGSETNKKKQVKEKTKGKEKAKTKGKKSK